MGFFLGLWSILGRWLTSWTGMRILFEWVGCDNECWCPNLKTSMKQLSYFIMVILLNTPKVPRLWLVALCKVDLKFSRHPIDINLEGWVNCHKEYPTCCVSLAEHCRRKPSCYTRVKKVGDFWRFHNPLDYLTKHQFYCNLKWLGSNYGGSQWTYHIVIWDLWGSTKS